MKRDFTTAGFLMLMTCGLFCGMAIFLRMDMLMTLFIVLALRSFFIQYQSNTESRRQHILFPIWIFLAVFSKGPMGILIPLAGTVVFVLIEKNFGKWLKIWNWSTWLILLAGCLLWFAGVFIEGGTAYLDNLLVKQTVGRAVNSFHHDRPWWFYFRSILYGWIPWSLLIIGSVCYLLKNWKTIPTLTEKYFLTISITTFLLLSCISSKIDIYLLPAYPFFIFSTVILLSRLKYNPYEASGLLIPVGALLSALIGSLIYNAVSPIQQLQGIETIAYIAAAVMIVGLTVTLIATLRKKEIEPGIRFFSLTLLTTIFVASFALPRFNCELGYGAVSRKAAEISAEKNVKCYAWKMNRPENIDVYLHHDILLVDTPQDSCNMWAEARSRGVAVISRQDRQPKPLVTGSVRYDVGNKFCVTYIPKVKK